MLADVWIGAMQFGQLDILSTNPNLTFNLLATSPISYKASSYSFTHLKIYVSELATKISHTLTSISLS
jgi:hypothetical protein